MLIRVSLVGIGGLLLFVGIKIVLGNGPGRWITLDGWIAEALVFGFIVVLVLVTFTGIFIGTCVTFASPVVHIFFILAFVNVISP